MDKFLLYNNFLRNKSCTRKRLIEDAQQSSIKCVARRFDPGLFDFKTQCFYCEKSCIDDKKHSDRKNFEIASLIKSKIYTSTLETYKDREDNGAKNNES